MPRESVAVIKIQSFFRMIAAKKQLRQLKEEAAAKGETAKPVNPTAGTAPVPPPPSTDAAAVGGDGSAVVGAATEADKVGNVGGMLMVVVMC